MALVCSTPSYPLSLSLSLSLCVPSHSLSLSPNRTLSRLPAFPLSFPSGLNSSSSRCLVCASPFPLSIPLSLPSADARPPSVLSLSLMSVFTRWWIQHLICICWNSSLVSSCLLLSASYLAATETKRLCNNSRARLRSCALSVMFPGIQIQRNILYMSHKMTDFWVHWWSEGRNKWS